MKKSIVTAILSLAAVANLSAQAYFEKNAAFPADATPEEKVDIASRVVPTPQQLEWQHMELTAFLHFGVNTFTGREWGDGKEDPSVFNPTQLDCEQWVRALKDGGFKMAIITAKHHDGFCLWPTKTTKHSVASSKWKDGKGDVVRELRDACTKYGLKFGVYLSPWDRNADCYGQGEAYNKFFIEQLTELLSNYGEVHEVWFDGANGEGPNGKKQVYDWENIMKTIRRLQPKAVTAIMGNDVRWVGNERGIGRETEWSATVLTSGSYTRAAEQNKELGINGMAKDLGSRDLIARAKEIHWFPSEVDVSIRPGWFYHAEQDNQVKSLKHLTDIYFQSVGYNSVLLLNIPPDCRGLIHENDAARIKQMAEYLKATFATNYLQKGDKAWSRAQGTSYIYKVKKGAVVNTFMLQEDISKGQHVESYLVEGYMNGEWNLLAEGTTIGYKRLFRFSDCTPERIRVTLQSVRGKANILNAGLYYAQPIADKSTKVKLNDVSTADWKIIEGDAEMAKAIDGKQDTDYKADGLTPIAVDMGKAQRIKGFCYAPTMKEDLTGTIYKYAFYVSDDGKTWRPCKASGEFSNIMHNPVPYYVPFATTYLSRYFRLVPLAEINGESCTTVAEIGIILEK